MELLRFRVEQPLDLRSFLKEKLGLSGRAVKRIIDRGWVFVNFERVFKASSPLFYDDIVEVIKAEVDLSYKILYEDDYILAVSKPSFISTNESPDSLEALLNREGRKAKAIHRLDLESTGVLLFAKSDEVFERFKELFKKRRVNKVYKVIAEGKVEGDRFSVSLPVDGKEALSLFRVLRRSELASLLEVRILTGRKHQIRVHLSEIGHPVVGEKVYRRGKVSEEVIRRIPRAMIHCEELSFEHPFLRNFISIIAPLPEDFRWALSILF